MNRILLALVFCAAACAQVAKEANSRYETHEGRQAVAKGLSAPDRDARQKPEELVRAMQVKPGMTVADIGTGVGYMLPFLSRAVASDGRVLAEDIFDDFLDQARERAAREKLANVTFIKGSTTDPDLPANAVDEILALDSYHHYGYPEKMLAAFHRALKPDGRLVIVEYYKRPDAMAGGGAMQHIRLDAPDLIKEVESNGFRLVSQHEHIPHSQYMAIFEKR